MSREDVEEENAELYKRWEERGIDRLSFEEQLGLWSDDKAVDMPGNKRNGL